MHGRLKVKTSAELEAQRLAEKTKQKQLFSMTSKLIFEARDKAECDAEQLKRTAQLLLANSDVATFWNIRKDILLRLGDESSAESELETRLRSELELTQQCLSSNPKSYCTWHHRRFCLLRLSDQAKVMRNELKLCNKYLEMDERNFHVWDHRTFVVNKAGIGDDEELDYTRKRIDANFSNYSAWQRRSRLITKTSVDNNNCEAVKSVQVARVDERKLTEEFELVQNAAFTDPEDSSAFFYHTWIMGHHKSNSSPLSRQREQERPLRLGVQVDRREFVKVAFNKPMSCDDFIIFAQISEEEKNSEIKLDLEFQERSNATPRAKVWNARLSFVKAENCSILSLKVPSASVSVDVFLDESGSGRAFLDDELSNVNGAHESSKDMEGMLKSELDMCNELLDYEPDSKWALITKQMLMIALDPIKNKDSIMKTFDQLVTVDGLRKGFYCDWRSRFVINTAFKGYFCKESKLDLSSMRLTYLPDPERLTFVNEIDLSRNELKSREFIDVLGSESKVILGLNPCSDDRDYAVVESLTNQIVM